LPLATQVGGVEKRPEACMKKEDKEERVLFVLTMPRFQGIHQNLDSLTD
jgi:hypothetical protein